MKEKDNSEERILHAAKKVFLAKGMDGARMQDIADESGMNKALLHYYFRNKEKLFEVIFKESIDQLFPKILNILVSEIPLFEKIEKFCSEYIGMMQQNTYLPMFVLNEVNKQPDQFREKYWNGKEFLLVKFIEQIQRETNSGTIKNVEPAHLFLNMISMCIFPFISKPIWMMSSGMNDEQYNQFMEQRKTEIPKFIIDSIKI